MQLTIIDDHHNSYKMSFDSFTIKSTTKVHKRLFLVLSFSLRPQTGHTQYINIYPRVPQHSPAMTTSKPAPSNAPKAIVTSVPTDGGTFEDNSPVGKGMIWDMLMSACFCGKKHLEDHEVLASPAASMLRSPIVPAYYVKLKQKEQQL